MDAREIQAYIGITALAVAVGLSFGGWREIGLAFLGLFGAAWIYASVVRK